MFVVAAVFGVRAVRGGGAAVAVYVVAVFVVVFVGVVGVVGVARGSGGDVRHGRRWWCSWWLCSSSWWCSWWWLWRWCSWWRCIQRFPVWHVSAARVHVLTFLAARVSYTGSIFRGPTSPPLLCYCPGVQLAKLFRRARQISPPIRPLLYLKHRKAAVTVRGRP